MMIARVLFVDDELSHAMVRFGSNHYATVCASRSGDPTDLAFVMSAELKTVAGPPTCLWCAARGRP